MISTRTGRAKELDDINSAKKKLKRSSITEIPVRVDSKTVLLIRKGKDPQQAIDDYNRRKLQSNNSFIY